MSSIIRRFAGLSVCVAAVSVAIAQDYSKQVMTLGKEIPAPPITIDVTDAPELKAWAEQAQKLATEWWPHITALLSTENYKAPKTMHFVFKKGIDAPAYTTGDTITYKVEWLTAHPDDFGIVIHEMTHVIQGYRRVRDAGWLVEGIADYIRWWRFEPESKRSPINKEKATYHDAYRTTAAFLAWVAAAYDRNIVRELDKSLREGNYSNDLFEKYTGKKVDDLWTEFIATIK